MATATTNHPKASNKSPKQLGQFATIEEASQAKNADLLKTLQRLNVKVVKH